jgi:sugar phosphate isomerase/epimerase
MRITAASRSALLSYCTNLHPADDLDSLARALEETTADVARSAAPDSEFGLGLRLGEDHVRELSQGAARARFEELLARHRFFVFTINGFAQCRFHERRVKHGVYLPDWTDPSRARYTLELARLLARWVPKDDPFGTISTLPIAWRAHDASLLERAAAGIASVASSLAALEQESGVRIMLCIEPEPGCAVETIGELVEFFENDLLRRRRDQEDVLRRYVGACYDACHQAVLFADPEADLAALSAAGISVGKVQISNALRLRYPDPRGLRTLTGCAEERFLHQVALRRPGHLADLRFDDLPDLEAAVGRGEIAGPGEARCHFHVPVYAEAFPPLETTRDDLVRALAAVLRQSDVRHFEVETYTFTVLPDRLRTAPLRAQLLREIDFARSALGSG